MEQEQNSRAFLKIAIFSVIVIIAALAIAQLAAFKAMERATMDLRFRVRRSPNIDPRISLVLVDSTAADRYGYPVPREYYARVARALCDNGASAVVIDRTFEWMERNRRKSMDELAIILKLHDNIIAAWHSPKTDIVSSTDPPITPVRFAMPHKINEIDVSPFETSLEPEKVSLPYHAALQNVRWLGAVLAEKASGNRIEKLPLVVKHGDRIYPSISLIAACVALKVDLADLGFGRRRISIPTEDGAIVIPTDERGQIRINYVGGRQAFLKNTHSLARVYESMLSDDQFLPMESFGNRIVLIGNDDIMGTDMHTTPFGESLISGLAIHATVINSILQNRFIDTAPWYFNLLVLILVVSCISCVQNLLSPRMGLICLAGILISIAAGAMAYFQFRGILINISQPMSGGIIAFTSATFYSYVAERRRVGHIKQVFGKHVSQEIMDRIVMEGDGQVPMTERAVTALFVDITGNSKWARHLKPSQFAKELNECLEAMAQGVYENGGTINVFLGDGLLALYNAPVEQHDHALRAIRTGISIQENISKLNERRIAQDKQPLTVRVGINTGLAMAGTLGSKERLEYTVVGDTINMASRTEGECGPGRVAITDEVVREVGDAVQVESIGMRRVKGREDGLMLYHVVEVREEDEWTESDMATTAAERELPAVVSSFRESSKSWKPSKPPKSSHDLDDLTI